jgi:transcriptional regulator with XRE-family HTH domain
MRSEAKIGTALQQLREITNVTQEDFGVVSSRTYVSTVERGLKSPTLGKIEQLAGVLGVHPLTLLTVAYMNRLTPKEVEHTIAILRTRLLDLLGQP